MFNKARHWRFGVCSLNPVDEKRRKSKDDKCNTRNALRINSIDTTLGPFSTAPLTACLTRCKLTYVGMYLCVYLIYLISFAFVYFCTNVTMHVMQRIVNISQACCALYLTTWLLWIFQAVTSQVSTQGVNTEQKSRGSSTGFKSDRKTTWSLCFCFITSRPTPWTVVFAFPNTVAHDPN